MSRMQGSATAESLLQHKLCGFCCIVLTVDPQQPEQHEQKNDGCKTLDLGTRCYLFGDGSNELGFRTEDGFMLLPVQAGSNSVVEESAEVDYVASTPDLGKRKVLEGECGSSTAKKKKTRIGMVHGSTSVVHQLRVLTGQKCFEIVARVVGISVRGDGNARGVVLVDVFLPLAVWSGWQFPKSGARAASVFRHLRCYCACLGT